MKYWQIIVPVLQRLKCCKNKKISKLLFVCFFFSFVHVPVIGAAQPVSIQADNMEIRKVIKSIEQQSDYRFFYTDGLTDLDRKVSMNFASQNIDSILSMLLADTQLSYRVSNNKRVILAPRETMQQGDVVTGTVVDKDGPMVGVSIVVKGTSQGTISDINGKYSIAVPGKNSVLQFSFLGYTPKEVVVGDRKGIDITLTEDVNELSEVVVVGYGTSNKLTYTGAVSSVKTGDLLRSSVPNVGNMLVGQVTGLSSVQTTALPGSDDPDIFVRGIGTLRATDAKPLILVDGMERSFFQLDANEIESITILKDASATAVFGVQGANGVILVTTRRGEEGAPKISVSLSAGAQVPLRVLDFVDSYNFGIAYNEMVGKLNDGQYPFSDQMLEKFKTGSDPLLYPSHNWMKEMVKPFAMQTQDNINISGGNKIIKYFASLGYFSQDGMMKEFTTDFRQDFTYKRYNFRSNFDINATKTTKLSVSIGGISGNRSEPINSEANVNFDTATFRDIYWGLPFYSSGVIDGKLINANATYVDPTGTIGGQARGPFDYWYGKGLRSIYKGELNLDLAIEQKLDFLLKGLSAQAKYSYNSNYTHQKNRTYSVPVYTPWKISHTNGWQNVDPNADPDEVVLVTNSEEALWGYNESFPNKSRKFYWEGALRYDRKFGNHQVSGLFLGNAKKTFYLNTDRYNYPNVPLGSMGFVWRATYNYLQKYLLEFNAGYNGSENFAPGKRFGFFPSASIGWAVTEEKFMQKVPFISFLKLRASVGKVGSDYVGQNRFLYLPDTWNPSDNNYYFGPGTNYQLINGAHEKKIGNPDVTWETAVKQNYGIDFSFLKGRLAFNVDRFFEKRRDILSARNTIPAYIAVDLPWGNISKVDNQGYEVQVKWKDRLGDDRRNSYWVGANVSYSRNKIVFQDEIQYEYPWLQKTGHRVGQYYGYVFEGLLTAADDPASIYYDDPLKNTLKPGDAKYKDLDGDGKIDANDVQAIGYSQYPDYIFAFNAGFSYKGFDFSMLWQGATHVSTNLSGLYRIPFSNTNNRNLMLYPYEHRYVSEKLTPDATYPRFANETRGWNYDNTTTNSFWVKDGTYLRLKNAEIGYTVSAPFCKKLGMQNFRIFLNGTNLLTFDKIIFIDPEETGNNTEYPNLAVINFGINFNF